MHLRIVLAGSVALVVAAAIAVPALAGSGASVTSSALASAESSLLSGLNAQQQVIVPTGASTSEPHKSLSLRITTTVRSSMKTSAETRLRKYFAGSALATEVSVAR